MFGILSWLLEKYIVDADVTVLGLNVLCCCLSIGDINDLLYL